jgi:hypothetical protein
MGVIKAGATPDGVGEVRSWDSDETVEVQDSSVMGSCQKRQTATTLQTALNLNCYYEAADAGQLLLVPGDEVDLELYPEGDGSSMVYFTCTALITSRKRSADVNGLIEFAIAATAQGALTQQAVA